MRFGPFVLATLGTSDERVLCLHLPEDREVEIGVFPEGEEIRIDRG